MKCGNRNAIAEYSEGEPCELCRSTYRFAGYLWITRLFDKDFVKKMSYLLDTDHDVAAQMGSLNKILFTCIDELD